MRIYQGGFLKVRKSFVVVVIWVISQGLFSLIDVNAINPILFTIGCGIFFIVYPSCMKISLKDPFTYMWLGFYFLLILEIINCWLQFGEPIYIAIKQILYLLPYILYYPIRQIIAWSDNYEYVKKCFILIGSVACIMGYVLYFLGGEFGPFTGELGVRDGKTTLVFCRNLVVLSTWLIISDFFDEDGLKYKFFWGILLFLHVMNFVLLMRYRAQAIGILAACIAAFVFTKTLKKWQKIGIVIIVVLVFLLTNNAIKSMLINVFEQVITGTNTFGIRLSALAYFFEEWKKHPLLGFGGISLTTAYRTDYTALYSYYTSDVGIVGWLYKYGIVGIIFFLYYILTVARCAIVKLGDTVRVSYLAIAYLGFRLSTLMTMIYFDYSYQGMFYLEMFSFAMISVKAEKYKKYFY